MKTIKAEIKFNLCEETANQELELLRKKPTKEKIDNIKERVKELEQCITSMVEVFGNSRINQKDVEIKVEGYRKRKRAISGELEQIDIKFKNKDLFEKVPLKKEALSSQERLRLENRQMAERQKEQLTGIHKVLTEAATVTKDTVSELHGQQQTMQRVENEADEAEGELSMINEFMGIISNRNLLTRLILLALALFLGAADLVIIILKIS